MNYPLEIIIVENNQHSPLPRPPHDGRTTTTNATDDCDDDEISDGSFRSSSSADDDGHDHDHDHAITRNPEILFP